MRETTPNDFDPAELTDDALTGSFRVFQRRRGHRYSLDDTLTAWEAACLCPEARRVVDLGCGLGSVLLMLAYKLPGASLIGVEAQAQSFALARGNVARNGVAARVTLHHADLRDPDLWTAVGGGHDLVTGTPPYQPPGQGTVSPDSQRAHARVELRGGIEDYLRAAAQLLSPDGRVVVCGDARTPERAAAGGRAAGLQMLSERRVWPAARYKHPLFSVWTFARRGAVPADQPVARRPDWVARDQAGGRTEDALALRRFFDLDIDRHEPNSPRLRSRTQVVRDQTERTRAQATPDREQGDG